MNLILDPLKELLTSFRSELSELVLLEKKHPIIINESDPIKFWERTEAYSWIFFETQYSFFWSISEETKKKNFLTCYPESLLKKADDYYSRWGMKTIEIHGCKTQIANLKEIYKYKKYGIPKPFPSEPLITHVKRLRELTTKETYSKKIWKESLGSYLEFVKASIPSECQGFINDIFPEDRTFYSDTIIRLTTKEKFPTNIIFIAEILKNLSDEILEGNHRAQYSNAETLAFAWLCMTCSRIQIPTNIKLLHSFDFSSLIVEECPERLFFSKRHLLKIPTLFGNITMEISKRLFEYFSILQQSNQTNEIKISFKSSQRSLERSFEKAVNKLNLSLIHGKITFSTLTNWPTEVLYHRTQIDNSRYKVKNKQI